MSERIQLSHGLNGVFLVVFAFFAATVTALGVLVAAGAERIVAAGEGGSATAYFIFGVIIAVIGLLMARASLRGFGAVAIIDIDAERNWTLRTRFGRTLALVPPEEGRRFELRGRRIFILAASVPKVQEIVEGRLALRESGRSFPVAVSGPTTYDAAFDALGYEERAPRPGEQVII